MFNLEKKWLIVQAYKHFGGLHREWSHSYVVEENENYYVLVSIRSAVIESDGRKWHTKEPAIFYLSKKDWFNVIAMFKENGICYYVNIASPTIYDKGILKYIDYDLDVKLYGDGTTRLLDISEYRKHAEEQGYGDDIKEIIENSVKKVYDMINNRTYPFVDADTQGYLDKFNRNASE